MAGKIKPRVKPRPLMSYVRKLLDSNLYLTDNDMMGASNYKLNDILINVDHPGHEEVDEVLNTVTHEIVHRVSPPPPGGYDPTDPGDVAQSQADEAAVEVITEDLLTGLIWQAVLRSWLLVRLWSFVREARVKGVNFE